MENEEKKEVKNHQSYSSSSMHPKHVQLQEPDLKHPK